MRFSNARSSSGIYRVAAAPGAAVASRWEALTAKPPAEKPELGYVPDDAAVFVHADVASLLNSAPGKSIRDADPKLLAEVMEHVKEAFGETTASLANARAELTASEERWLELEILREELERK